MIDRAKFISDLDYLPLKRADWFLLEEALVLLSEVVITKEKSIYTIKHNLKAFYVEDLSSSKSLLVLKAKFSKGYLYFQIRGVDSISIESILLFIYLSTYKEIDPVLIKRLLES